MQQWLGNPYGAGWLQVSAFLLLLVPMNLLVGGSIIAAVTATGTRTVESRRLVAWLTHSYPAAMGWSAIAGLVALRPLTSHVWPKISSCTVRASLDL